MASRNTYKGSSGNKGRGSLKRKLMNPHNLNDHQVQFCLEYCKTLSVAQAYMTVYPSANLAASRTAAQKLWANPGVQTYVNELMHKKVKEHELSIDETLRLLNQIAHESKQDNVRVQALDKLLKYFGGYVKHQEAGASKNVFLGMSDEDLRKNSASLLLQFKENNVKGKLVEKISFEEISYEEIPTGEPVERAEERNEARSRELGVDE